MFSAIFCQLIYFLFPPIFCFTNKHFLSICEENIAKYVGYSLFNFDIEKNRFVQSSAKIEIIAGCPYRHQQKVDINNKSVCYS